MIGIETTTHDCTECQQAQSHEDGDRETASAEPVTKQQHTPTLRLIEGSLDAQFGAAVAGIAEKASPDTATVDTVETASTWSTVKTQDSDRPDAATDTTDSESSRSAACQLSVASSASTSVSASSASSSSSDTSHVSFGTVQVRRYQRVPGNHPEVRFGIPLAIGWSYVEDDSVDVEDFERNPRRSGVYKLSRQARRKIFHEQVGMTQEQTCAIETRLDQKRRTQRKAWHKAWTKVKHSHVGLSVRDRIDAIRRPVQQ